MAEIDTVDEQLIAFRHRADTLRSYIDWDEIILYAIYSYDDDNALVSADFMLVRMTYEKYVRFISTINQNCRPFFIGNYT